MLQNCSLAQLPMRLRRAPHGAVVRSSSTRLCDGACGSGGGAEKLTERINGETGSARFQPTNGAQHCMLCMRQSLPDQAMPTSRLPCLPRPYSH